MSVRDQLDRMRPRRAPAIRLTPPKRIEPQLPTVYSLGGPPLVAETPVWWSDGEYSEWTTWGALMVQDRHGVTWNAADSRYEVVTPF